MNKPLATFDDIHTILGKLPDYRDISPPYHHPRVSIYAATHAVAPPDETKETLETVIAAYREPDHRVANMAEGMDADLRVYEMALERPAGDWRIGDLAMTEEQTVLAMTFGMMTVEPGVDALVLSSLSSGALLSASKMLEGLAEEANPLLVLQTCGGEDIAALMGAMLAARMAGVPVWCDGLAAATAACVLKCLDERTVPHIHLAWVGQVPGASRARAILGLRECVEAVEGNVPPGLMGLYGVQSR